MPRFRLTGPGRRLNRPRRSSGCVAPSLWADRAGFMTSLDPQPDSNGPPAAEPLGPGAMAELSAVTGGLAHEIRNPLSTLKVNLQLLDEDWRDVAAADPATADLVRRSSKRLTTMIREVDRLARILDDALRFLGHHELNRRACDLRELLDELAEFLEPQARAEGVAIERRYDGAAVTAAVDPDLIKIALTNLMTNAIQAMPAGGVLTLRARNETGGVCIEVADTGVGIPPEQVGRIFDAFYSTRKGGTGLGLATARRIIREHGGRIDVRSEVGRGTTFSIRLAAGT